MFAALTQSSLLRSGISGRILDKISPRRPKAQQKSALGIQFLHIESFLPMNARGWRAVERAAGPLCGAVVVAPDIVVPEISSVVRVTGESAFLPLLTVNTAVEIFHLARLAGTRRTLGVVDPNGVWQKLILQAAPYCAAVMVLTDAPERYTRFCEQIFDVHGVPVELCRPGSEMKGCAVIAAPSGISEAQCRTLAAPVLSARPCPAIPRAPVLDHLRICPSPQLAEEIPLGLDATEFASALYASGAVAQLANSSATQGRLAGGRLEMFEFAQIVENWVNTA